MRNIRLVVLFPNLTALCFIFSVNIINLFAPPKTPASSVKKIQLSAQHVKIFTEPRKFTIRPY